MITHASSNVPSRLIGPPAGLAPLTIEVRLVPDFWLIRGDFTSGVWATTDAPEGMPYFLVREKLLEIWPEYSVVWVEQEYGVKWEDA